MPAKKKEQKRNSSLDIYRNHHQWDTTRMKRTLDSELVDYYINNDLDINELYDNMKLYNYDDKSSQWKHKKR